MKSKAALQVAHGAPLVIEEVDIADPGPNQVTIRNFASGVCYSQVHQLRNPQLPRPMGLGHEGCGVDPYGAVGPRVALEEGQILGRAIIEI
ncbi:MAG TPA: alcohol dehydrogenase catalytic domain-containing protein [Streptosporangiaceae bacterium]|nr:alcohol dehydrogenase catalytic domain-containing protein [Streptosporangiaceae bacterium]